MKRNSPKVWVNSTVLLQLFKEFCLHFPNETGGVLMGFKKNSNYWITTLIGPGPNAVHDRRMFVPDYKFHEKEIAVLYNSTGGRETYLGDWHTHPTESAYLSALDKTTLGKIADYKPARLPRPLMMIFGSDPMEIKCWRYDKSALGYNRYQPLDIGYAPG